MNSGWKTEALGEVVDFQRGLTYSKKDEAPVSRNIVLRANNINLVDHSLDLSDLKYINENVVVPETKKVKKGSLLICTASGSKSHLGKVALVDEDYGYAFGGFMGQLTPRKSINPYFLFYVLTSEPYKDFIGAMSDGVNINNLKFDDLKSFAFALPPLPEQQRIVAVLDEAFAGIAKATENAQKNLANARELFESHLQSIFATKGDGWVEKKVGDLCTLFDDGDWIESKDQSESGIRLIQTGNVGVGTFKSRAEKARYISEETFARLKCTEIFEGDCLVSRLPDPVGRACIIPDVGEKMITAVDCTIIRFKPDKMIPQFFNYYAQSALYLREVESLISGATRQRISRSNLGKVLVPVPPLPEQQRIVAQLDTLATETKRLEAIYQQKLEHLAALRQSILQKAFAGELSTDRLAA